MQKIVDGVTKAEIAKTVAALTPKTVKEAAATAQ
jgi:hypothetical protein